jgi:DNA gyrase subunit A
MPVEDVKRLGRATQGVIVMRLRGDERVSSLAPVVESDEDDDAAEPVAPAPEGAAAEPDPVAEDDPDDEPEDEAEEAEDDD